MASPHEGPPQSPPPPEDAELARLRARVTEIQTELEQKNQEIQSRWGAIEKNPEINPTDLGMTREDTSAWETAKWEKWRLETNLAEARRALEDYESESTLRPPQTEPIWISVSESDEAADPKLETLRQNLAATRFAYAETELRTKDRRAKKLGDLLEEGREMVGEEEFYDMKSGITREEIETELMDAAQAQNAYRDALNALREYRLRRLEAEGLNPEQLRKELQAIITETSATEANRLYDLKTKLKIDAHIDIAAERGRFRDTPRQMFEFYSSLGMQVVEWYRKLPIKYKLAVSGALFGAGMGGAALGVPILMAATGGAVALQRLLGAGSAAIAAEALAQGRYEKKARKEVGKEIEEAEKLGEQLSALLALDDQRLNNLMLEQAGRKFSEKAIRIGIATSVFGAIAAGLPGKTLRLAVAEAAETGAGKAVMESVDDLKTRLGGFLKRSLGFEGAQPETPPAKPTPGRVQIIIEQQRGRDPATTTPQEPPKASTPIGEGGGTKPGSEQPPPPEKTPPAAESFAKEVAANSEQIKQREAHTGKPRTSQDSLTTQEEAWQRQRKILRWDPKQRAHLPQEAPAPRVKMVGTETAKPTTTDPQGKRLTPEQRAAVLKEIASDQEQLKRIGDPEGRKVIEGWLKAQEALIAEDDKMATQAAQSAPTKTAETAGGIKSGEVHPAAPAPEAGAAQKAAEKITAEKLVAVEKLATVQKGEGYWQPVRRQLYEQMRANPQKFALAPEDAAKLPKNLEDVKANTKIAKALNRETMNLLTREGIVRPDGTETRIAKPGVKIWITEDGHIGKPVGEGKLTYDTQRPKAGAAADDLRGRKPSGYRITDQTSGTRGRMMTAQELTGAKIAEPPVRVFDIETNTQFRDNVKELGMDRNRFNRDVWKALNYDTRVDRFIDRVEKMAKTFGVHHAEGSPLYSADITRGAIGEERHISLLEKLAEKLRKEIPPSGRRISLKQALETRRFRGRL